MRHFMLLAPLLPLPALAETFTIPTRTSDVVLYAYGGIATHAFSVSLPAGQHELVLPDLPPFLDLESLVVDTGAFGLDAITVREDFVPPRTDTPAPELEAAEDAVAAAQKALAGAQDRVRLALMPADAARARIRFLAALGQNEGLNQDPAALSELANVIAEQTLSANQTILAADQEARHLSEPLEDLQSELTRAKAALAALRPEPEERPYVRLNVSAPQALNDVQIRVSFFTDAEWQPTYDWHLDSAGSLTLERGARVTQRTGTNWENVSLTLSTHDLDAGTDASPLFPWLRRIEDPAKAEPRVMMRSMAADVAAPVIDAPVIVEESVGASVASQGLALTYSFANTVDVASGADNVWLPFDTVRFDAELVARATPLQDKTAYVAARFTNTSDEPILNSRYTRRFFDGGFVGEGRDLAPIAPGEEAELGFGQILGLQLSHVVLKRNEGDRGFVSRSNEQEQSARISVKNLTQRAWPVELRHRVPYSEQEDLEITYTSKPAPDMRAVDDQRGILQWNLDLAPGDTRDITTGFRITWPEGQILR